MVDLADRSIVSVIEVLSPSNKVAGAAGLESFQEKRNQVMRSPAHWVEIDLLRAGVSLTVDENSLIMSILSMSHPSSVVGMAYSGRFASPSGFRLFKSPFAPRTAILRSIFKPSSMPPMIAAASTWRSTTGSNRSRP